MKSAQIFTGVIRLTGLLIAVRFGLLEGTVLGGKPDATMLLVAAFMLTGAQAGDSLARVLSGTLGAKEDKPE